MAGKFEIYRDAFGDFRFRLKAANGEIIASSEGYKSRAAAQRGIESVRANAAAAELADTAAGGRHGREYRHARDALLDPVPMVEHSPATKNKRHLRAAGAFDSGRSDISERMEEILAAEVEQ